MMDPKNVQNEKILSALEKLKLPEAQLAKAEEFMSGRAGEEILGELEERDLSGVAPEPFVRLFLELTKKGKDEDASKLFALLFAIGKASYYQMVPMNLMTMKQGAITQDPAKKAAVYSMRIGMFPVSLGSFAMKGLESYAEGNPKNLRRAMDYQNPKIANGKIILLASYFMLKYGNAERKEPEGKKEAGLLERAGRLLGIKSGEREQASLIEKADENLMRQYEDSIISNLGSLYQNQISQGTLREIIDAVNRNQLTDRILRLADGKNNLSAAMMKLLGGMAYLNFPLSVKLKNVVRICLAADMKIMLNTIKVISQGLPEDICVKGGDYARVFSIDGTKYIQWAAEGNYKEILKEQLKKNQECYLKAMDKVGIESFRRMREIVQEQDETLYKKLVEDESKHGHNRKTEEVIRVLTGDASDASVVEAYLRGEAKVDSLYPYMNDIKGKYWYGGSRERDLLTAYEKIYPDEGFSRRCQVYMLLKGKGYFFLDGMRKDTKLNVPKVKKLFRDMEEEGLEPGYQLAVMSMLYNSMDIYFDVNIRKSFLDCAAECFADCLKERREEIVSAFQNAEAFGRFFGLHVMRRETEKNKKEILSFAPDSAKIVKEELLDILYGQKGWEGEIKSILDSKKAAERELAIRVLLHWQGKKMEYQELLIQALEKEKNAKVKKLLEDALAAEGGNGAGEKSLTRKDMVKELHKGGTKRSLEWAYQTPFSEVHRLNGEAAEKEYLQAVLLCYSSAGRCGISKKAAFLAEDLRQEELAVYVNELFDKWMEAGAEAKKRWVLYAASIHGGAQIIPKLQHQIQEWPQHARGAIAADAVQALSLNPLPQALLIVDGISRKFKFKQIKAAAGKALEFAASQLGISKEELADRIVPDFGFNEKMERVFDYGERSFKVMITPALEIEVYDAQGKRLKNMPAPGKRDEEAKASAAYEEFKQMKKQMKLTVTSQRMRLEQALSTGREWSVDAWKRLFVENPVMHQFAIGLIWGIYENKKLVQSFRYMEDGSFNTEDEEEYELPEKGQIGLVHPVDLPEEKKEIWKQQLEDYEITQPIEQLDRAVYSLTEDEAGMQRLERFGGCILNDLSLGGKLLNLGWYRGSVEDAGGFYTYYREDTELGIGVELHFSGSFVGGENEDVTVYDARFYKAGEVKRGSYVYDEAGEDKAYFLRDIPARYFSEVVLQLTKATASSQEKNEKWRETR